jgi:AcrR family transcriptional regulator
VRRARHDWASGDLFARRRELYALAAPVFRAHGYAGSTLKALAHACGLSIPGLYRYFPSKRSFALYPLISFYPELHPPPPDVSTGDPVGHLAFWIDQAVQEAPNYLLAASLVGQVGLADDEWARAAAALEAHIDILADTATRAAPQLSPTAARSLAAGMINVTQAPALTGIAAGPQALRRQLRGLVRGYGIPLP